MASRVGMYKQAGDGVANSGATLLACLLMLLGPLFAVDPSQLLAGSGLTPIVPASGSEDDTNELAKSQFSEAADLCHLRRRPSFDQVVRHLPVRKEIVDSPSKRFPGLIPSTISLHKGHGGPLRC